MALPKIPGSESKVEENRQWLFTTLRSISDALVASDEKGCVTFLNPAAEALTGWTLGEAFGRRLGEVLRLEDPRKASEFAGADFVDTPRDPAAVPEAEEAWVESRDGRKTPVEARSALIREDDGNIKGVVRILRDVTERKKAEEVLLQSEGRYRDLVERSQDILFTLTRDGILTSLNPAFEKATGWTREEWLGQPFILLLRPEDRDRAWAAFRRVQDGREQPPEEMRLRARSGGEVVLECTCVRAGAGAWGIGRDITHRKRLEERVLQNQKMEAIGRLAGGIAHDFNNLLTAITGYTDFLNRSLGKDSPLLHNVEGILSSVDRAANLTRQLLAFSRQQVASPRNLDLNEVIARMLPTLSALADENIDLALDLKKDLGPVFADPGQMERALLILIANSRDAMSKGGRLTLATSESLPTSDSPAVPGPHVVLTVSDTGAGISEEARARLFEPFFTTKPIGQGTGLGLSALYGIVKLAGGDIQVDGAPGRGASFHLIFPRAEKDATRPIPILSPDQLAGGETILLVEDDEEVRSLLSTILKSDGYAVVEAAGGEQALQMAGAHQGPLHLVLTDVHMPKMGGRQLVERLLSGNPNLKFIFMSGFAREDFPEAQARGLPVCFLEKPFMPKSLIRQIRKILDG